MALANYSDLLASIAGLLHRTDLTAQIPDFVTLLEADMNRMLRLRTMEDDEALTLVSAARTIALPTGYLEALELSIDLPPRLYPEYKVASQLPINTTYSGLPKYWTINGTNIEFDIPADQNYTVRFKMLKSFGLAASTTNWLMTNHPDIYLYGALLHSAPYLGQDSRIPTWQMFYNRAMKGVLANAVRSKALAKLSTNLPRSTRGTFNINLGE